MNKPPPPKNPAALITAVKDWERDAEKRVASLNAPPGQFVQSNEVQRLRDDHKRAMRSNRILTLMLIIAGLSLLFSALSRIWSYRSPAQPLPTKPPAAPVYRERVCDAHLVRWPSGPDRIADPAPACNNPRQVPCPAQCNAGEVADTTQRCIFDPQLYKVDGKGCAEYVPVCWCKVPCPPMPEVLKL